MTDIEHRLARELRRRAEALTVSPPPLDAIERAARPARTRWLITATAAAIVVLVVVGAAILSGDQAPPAPTDPPAVLSRPFDWSTRGSLRQDTAFLAAARDRVSAETRLGQAPTDTVHTVIWFAGDTPAGRIVVGAAGLVDTRRTVTRSEMLVLAGPGGAALGDLSPAGNAGESADGPVSRLISGDGGWWLFVLGAPEIDEAEVSWAPRYGPDGRLPRDWTELPATDGVVTAQAPGRAVAARLRLLRDGRVVTDQPVIEDSDNLNDPSFFPVELGVLAPLRTDVDLKGADRDTVTRLANQVGVATGVSVRDMRVTIRWTRTDAGGARVLATLELPGGGIIAGYATGPERTIDLVPVPRRDLDRLTFVHRFLEPVDGQPGRLAVVAPHAPGGQVRLSGQQVQLDGTGYAELDFRSDGDPTVEIRSSGGDRLGSVRLNADERTDPFGLRG